MTSIALCTEKTLEIFPLKITPPQFSNFLYGDNLRWCISRNRIALSCGGRLTVPYCRHYHDGNKRVKYYRRRWACGESGRCIYDGRSAWVPTCRYQIAAKRDRKPLCHWHATRVIIFTKSMPRATRPAPPDTKNIVADSRFSNSSFIVISLLSGAGKSPLLVWSGLNRIDLPWSRQVLMITIWCQGRQVTDVIEVAC